MLTAACRTAIHSHLAKQEEHRVDNGNIGAFKRYAYNKFSFKSSIEALKK